MKRFVFALALLLPTLALAQEAAHETLLHLSASGTVSAPPDQLVAELIAQNTSPTPAAAQRRVNAQMAKGLADAKTVSAVTARALGYMVGPYDGKQTAWTAQQTLELLSTDGPTLLDLAGKLQDQGFVTGTLDWRLSPSAHERAMAEATIRALKALQSQASAAATALDLHVAYLKDVQIAPREVMPLRPMGAVMARVATAPQATAAPQDVTITVSASYVLR